VVKKNQKKVIKITMKKNDFVLYCVKLSQEK